MSFGVPELLIVLAIVVVVFGHKRIKSLGTELGGAIKGFRKSVADDEPAAKSDDNEDTANQSTSNKASSA